MFQPTDPASDLPGRIDLNPASMVEKVDGWVDGLIFIAPNLLVAIVLIIGAFFTSGAIRSVIIRRANKRGRRDLGMMLGGLARWTIIVVGVLVAATIVMPTLNPGDLIAGLGIGSVAIGFAFKDILQNWLAGMLILLRQPFEINDQIVVNGYEGTVERILTRSTLIRTYDGLRAVIPNSDIYTSAVLVKTAHDLRRSQYDIGIGYGDGVEQARDVVLEALRTIPEIKTDPAPEALVWDLAASWVTIRARWWTDSRRADVVQVRGQVVTAVKHALDEAGIDMPYETNVMLFHDQTEETDGDRDAQREGWPAPRDTDKPKPRWKATMETVTVADPPDDMPENRQKAAARPPSSAQ